MQIEIDFEVFKALTALRKSELDSYNGVVRRLLKLPDHTETLAAALLNYADKRLPALENAQVFRMSDLAGQSNQMKLGVWFGQTHFPEGTKFRATYKGKTYLAEIRGGIWVGDDGIVRRSPSDAAGAISGTNVNGWRFWYAQIPPSEEWHRLDEHKRCS